MTTGYLPVIVLGVLATAFAALSLIASTVLRPSHATRAKQQPYECGIEPIRLPAQERFPVKFYVIAMLFIIFDVEVIFLFPWAVASRSLGLFGLVEMIVFVGLLFVAYVYVWQKGGLEWEGPQRTMGLSVRVERMPATVERTPGDHATVGAAEG